MADPKKKIAVIGSGFGGLATAIRLQAAGCDVTIFEKRDLPGGRAYVYHDSGFTFDAGPTVITAPHCLEELFTVCGRKMEDYVELVPLSPMYRLCWEDGDRFDYSHDLKTTVTQIEKRSLEDARNYERFLDYSREVFEAGYTELASVPFLNWGSMIRASPELLRLNAFRSVYGVVSKYIKDPHLRQAFSFHSLLVGGNPYSTSAIYTLIHYLEKKWGVFFPKGGTHALVTALVRLFEEMGGHIVYGDGVTAIRTDQGKVTGVATTKIEFTPCDAVVSNADVNRTYVDLLRKEPRVERTRRRIEAMSYSPSLFVIYFGTNQKYPDVAHHNILFGNRYRELLADIYDKGILADDFSLYLHAPTRTDPSLAPEGCDTFYALSPVPHLEKSTTDWNTEGPRYADRILDYLEKHYLPDLKSHIVTRRIFSPLDFKNELNAYAGSAFSLEPLLTQSAYFRAHNRDSAIRGLYLVGAGTHPGAGIPGVVNSAKATSGLVLEDLLPKPAIVRHSPAASLEEKRALEKCREMIRVGSKSFSFASRLFSRPIRDAACFLYGWCRYCDDQIDLIEDSQTQQERLSELVASTRVAFEEESAPLPEVFVALRYIARQYEIPAFYATELLEGLRMDLRRTQYRTLDELTLYGYRVAGTVGLMMSHVMGVTDERALKHAADLGIAMQLSNIARDVVEDFQMGRVYLPLEWLEKARVPAFELAEIKYRDGLARVVAQLLDSADGYYRSGNRGLRYLPLRSALAVAMASSVYAKIGHLVRKKGPRAWDRRTYVPLWRKCFSLVRGVFLVALTLPYRLEQRRKPIPLLRLCRHTPGEF